MADIIAATTSLPYEHPAAANRCRVEDGTALSDSAGLVARVRRCCRGLRALRCLWQSRSLGVLASADQTGSGAILERPRGSTVHRFPHRFRYQHPPDDSSRLSGSRGSHDGPPESRPPVYCGAVDSPDLFLAFGRGGVCAGLLPGPDRLIERHRRARRGCVLGVTLWLLLGDRLTLWWRDSLDERKRPALAQRILLAYCVLFGISQVMPLDLTHQPRSIGGEVPRAA